MKNNIEFFTFEKHVEVLREVHRRDLEQWAHGQRIIEIVRQHGGPDFRDYADFELERCHPHYPDIPDAPDLGKLAPYSIVTLSSPCANAHFPGTTTCSMLVVSVSGDRVDGIIIKSHSNAVQRIQVTKGQIVRSQPALQLWEVEPSTGDQFDDLPF